MSKPYIFLTPDGRIVLSALSDTGQDQPEPPDTPPYGYRVRADGKALELAHQEQTVIRMVREMHDAGRTLIDIATELRRRGFLSRQGKSFVGAQLAVMLETAPLEGPFLTPRQKQRIADRTALALAGKKQRGERVGGLHYGYAVGADGKTLVPVPAEQAVIAEVRKLRAAGVSFRRVAATLELNKIRSRSGRAFLTSQIQRMLEPVPIPGPEPEPIPEPEPELELEPMPEPPAPAGSAGTPEASLTEDERRTLARALELFLIWDWPVRDDDGSGPFLLRSALDKIDPGGRAGRDARLPPLRTN